MRAIEVKRLVSAEPEAVWAVVCDLDGSADVLSAVTSIERLGGPDGFGVGTRWRETRTMFGRSATEEMSVTAVEPGRSYTVAASSNGVDYTSVMAVAPAEGGTELSMSFAAVPRSLSGRILAATIGRLFVPATRKAVQQDLADIAAAAEQA